MSVPTKTATLESLEKKGGLVPWSQTKKQRLDLVKSLDHLATEFVDRERHASRHDPILKSIYLEGVILIVALKEPKAHHQFSTCLVEKQNADFCMQDFAAAYNRWFHLMDKKLQDKRDNPNNGFDHSPQW
jgi:hypothetical protein